MGRFDGQVVWITGGGSGLGAAMARRFAAQGAKVAVSGRRADRLEEVAAAIRAGGGEALAVPVDVVDEAAVQAAVGLIVEKLGGLDVAVANAGYGVMGTVERLTDAAWRKQLDVNVFGALNVVRHALPELKKSRGRVALVGSVAAFANPPSNAAYSASKAAIRAIGLTLSAELGGTGITCTTIHPGFVASEIGQVDNEGVFHADRKDPRPKALMWATDDAAKVMVDAIAARRREFVFTGHGKLVVLLSRLAPGLLAALVAKTAPKRSRATDPSPARA
jgi:NAD(P)-dependent dehydrogenase (short-subunit alcohol dehydrogenase family)